MENPLENTPSSEARGAEGRWKCRLRESKMLVGVVVQ